MTAMGADNTVLIQQINFNGDSIEVVYAEPRDIENAGKTGVVRTRIVAAPHAGLEPEIEELVEAAKEVVERIAVLERAPQSFSR